MFLVDSSSGEHAQTSSCKRPLRFGCEGYCQDRTRSFCNNTEGDVSRNMRGTHRSLTDPEDDQLRFVLLGIINYRVRNLAAIGGRTDGRVEGLLVLGSHLLQRFRHDLRNDVTSGTAFARPRKHMQAMKACSHH